MPLNLSSTSLKQPNSHTSVYLQFSKSFIEILYSYLERYQSGGTSLTSISVQAPFHYFVQDKAQYCTGEGHISTDPQF